LVFEAHDYLIKTITLPNIFENFKEPKIFNNIRPEPPEITEIIEVTEKSPKSRKRRASAEVPKPDSKKKQKPELEKIPV